MSDTLRVVEQDYSFTLPRKNRGSLDLHNPSRQPRKRPQVSHCPPRITTALPATTKHWSDLSSLEIYENHEIYERKPTSHIRAFGGIRQRSAARHTIKREISIRRTSHIQWLLNFSRFAHVAHNRLTIQLRGEHGTAFLINQTEQPENFFVPSKSTQQHGLFESVF